jgi:hypothetical protein
VRVVRKPVILRVAGLGLLLIDRMARGIRARMLLLLLRRRLAVMLLVNNTRRSRMLQVRRNRTLLLVMWVVLQARCD